MTGANAGIGKATALELARQGHTVVMACRSQVRGEKAQAEIRAKSGNNRVDLLLADLASQADVRRLADSFKARYSRLDALVNNAGLFSQTRQITEDGIEKTFAVNHLAHFLLTNLLLDVLKASAPARVVNVSSEGHRGARLDFSNLRGENGYNWLRAYGESKLANVLFTYELARRLEGTDVTTNAIHPGVVSSRIWNRSLHPISLFMRLFRPFMTRPKTSAEALARLAVAPELEGVTGRYFKKKKEAASSPRSHDQALAEKLWQVSEEMTGLSGPTPA
ncbi:MAG: SDR family oxidoreductase [Rhodothermales bacterium]